jgi:hypothetical protein
VQPTSLPAQQSTLATNVTEPVDVRPPSPSPRTTLPSQQPTDAKTATLQLIAPPTSASSIQQPTQVKNFVNQVEIQPPPSTPHPTFTALTTSQTTNPVVLHTAQASTSPGPERQHTAVNVQPSSSHPASPASTSPQTTDPVVLLTPQTSTSTGPEQRSAANVKPTLKPPTSSPGPAVTTEQPKMKTAPREPKKSSPEKLPKKNYKCKCNSCFSETPFHHSTHPNLSALDISLPSNIGVSCQSKHKSIWGLCGENAFSVFSLKDSNKYVLSVLEGVERYNCQDHVGRFVNFFSRAIKKTPQRQERERSREQKSTTYDNAQVLLKDAFNELRFYNGALGEATGVLAIVDRKSKFLSITTVGDGGYILVRADGSIGKCSTKNSYKLSYLEQMYPAGTVDIDADTSVLTLEENDILVLGSPGLFDNLFTYEIVGIVNDKKKKRILIHCFRLARTRVECRPRIARYTLCTGASISELERWKIRRHHRRSPRLHGARK